MMSLTIFLCFLAVLSVQSSNLAIPATSTNSKYEVTYIYYIPSRKYIGLIAVPMKPKDFD